MVHLKLSYPNALASHMAVSFFHGDRQKMVAVLLVSPSTKKQGPKISLSMMLGFGLADMHIANCS